MNRIYKLIWNPQLRAMVVASELASGQGRISSVSAPAAPRLALLSAACGMALMATAFGARAQQAELADLQNLVARYSQPVEDLSALVARASGTAQVEASANVAPASLSASANVAVSAQIGLNTAAALPVIRKVRHAGLSVTPAVQVQTVASALASASVGTAGLQPGSSSIASGLSAVSESLSSGGTGQAGAPVGRLLAALRPRDPAIDNRTNPVREGLVTVVGLVEDGTGKLLDKTHLGQVASGLLDGVGTLVAGVGNVAGSLVGGLTGSQALAGTVTGLTDALDGGLSAVGDNLEDTNLAGVVGAVGGTVHNAGNAVVGGVTGSVGGLTGSSSQIVGLNGVVGGLTGGLSNGLTNTVGSLTGNAAPADMMIAPMALQPGDPRLVPGGSRTSGLVVGTGGLVGTVGTLLGPTVEDLLGGDGYVRNGDTAINSANIVQAYSVTNVLGLPVVNLSPVGTLLDGLGGVTTGSNSHLTVIGGATSDSYIYNINNGNPNGLLGLVLPDQAPDWAQSCLNVLGLASIDCWAVNAAQDYQVLIGDGAYANGSKEVVIGTNARHQLPLADANDVFAGDGVNDPTNPTGVPTADYDARLGHSVVIGDTALGTANAQTLIGAGATSDKANSVALGYKSNASRGGMDNYSAYGLTAAQTSIGEVAVGSAGRERQITHVAAGSGDTDAVNVAQLRSAISTVSVGSNPFSVLYADNGAGAPDYTRIALGDGSAATTISNLADGQVSAGSSEAINGAQLHGTADSLAAALGGNAAVNADGTVSAPTYTLTSVAADGSTSTGDYNDVGSAFDAMDQSITNINTSVTNGLAGAVRYDTDAAGAVDFGQVTFGDGTGPTRLTNVADGSVAAGSSDAVTGSQLHAASDSVATNFGGGSVIGADGSVSAPTYSLTSVAADGSTSTGDYNDVGSAFDAVDQSISNINTTVTTGLAGAVRYDTDASGAVDFGQVTFGDGNGPTRLTNVADGSVAAGSSDAVTGSQLHAASASVATNFGGGSVIGADGSVSAPTYSLTSVAADGSTSTADYNDVGSAFDAVDQSINNINTTVTTGLAGAVRYDTDASGAVDYSQVTFGDGNGPTRLTNVADGSVAAGSSDAVTGSQLYAAGASVATNFGGGSVIGADGSVSAPTYSLTSVAANGTTSTADYNDVGSAFDAVDQSITNINTSITTGLAGAVRYDIDASGAVDYSQVTFGDGNGPTRLTNVADGNVGAASSDALTGAQLYSHASSVAAVIGAGAGVDANGNLTAPSFAITSIDASLGRTTGNYSDVGTAFSAMDASINNVANNLSVAIGGAVLYDRDAAGVVDYTRVTFGDGNTPTLLTNVAAGSVLAGSTDAVTGGQLHGNASSVAAHLGGGAAVAADGSVTAPTYAFDTVDGNGNLVAGSYSDVGSAFDAVGQSIRNIFNNGTGATDPLAVRYLADAQGNPSNLLRLTGSGSGAVSITNLAAAQVVAGSTDAVNGDQLAATNAALSSYLGGTTSFDGSSNAWVGPTFALTTVAADGTLSTSTFNDVTAAFNSVSQSLTNISNVPPGTPSTTPSPYLDVNSTGAPAQATGSEAIALGSAASSDGQAAVAIGQGASASAANSVALGAGSVADRANTVSVGATGDERQITHVADASQATDAVNLRQLQASQQGTVRYDQNTDGSTNYNSITLGQTSSGPALVRNVAAGVSSTDAVNVGQMQAGLDQVKDWSRNYTDDRFNSVSRDMRDIDNRASAGIASAMAMAGLPQPYEAGRSMASFAASSFNGEGSIAVGISGVSEGGRWIYKLSGSANTRGDGGVTVGAGIQW